MRSLRSLPSREAGFVEPMECRSVSGFALKLWRADRISGMDRGKPLRHPKFPGLLDDKMRVPLRGITPANHDRRVDDDY
jgi:hypothetical protein